MNLKPEIELIKQQLDEVEDQKLLNIIREMLAYGKSRSKNFKPLTEEDFYKRNEESTKAIEQGNVIAQEDAAQYFKRKKLRD